MQLEDIIGYWPFENPDSQVRSFLESIGVNSDFLGYEVLGNVDSLPAGRSIAELNHELLIRFNLLTQEKHPRQALESELIECIQGYIKRSIAENHDSPKVMDSNRISELILTNKDVVLNLEMILQYFALSQSIDSKESKDLVMVFRKIEYSSYFLLVATQTAILDAFSISPKEHSVFVDLPEGQTDKSIVFAKCFDLILIPVTYGKSLLGSPKSNYDKWLTKKIIPLEITREPYPKQSAFNMGEFQESFDHILELVQNPSKLSENIKQLSFSEESKEFRNIFGATLLGIFIWKDGLSYLVWLPIVGDFCGFLGNTGLGRIAGLGGFIYIIKDVEFRFKFNMLFIPENVLASMIILGMILGSIFTI